MVRKRDIAFYPEAHHLEKEEAIKLARKIKGFSLFTKIRSSGRGRKFKGELGFSVYAGTKK